MYATSPSKKLTRCSSLRMGLTMCVMSRSLAATSCSIGVKRKKFSRLTSVRSTSGVWASRFSSCMAVYTPPNPPPRMTICVRPLVLIHPPCCPCGQGCLGPAQPFTPPNWRGNCGVQYLPTRGKTGEQGHATIDVQADPCHIVGSVGRQPDRRVANVCGLADALVGHQRHQGVIGFGRVPGCGVDWGPDGAWGNAVDADAIGRHLLREAFHHQPHPALRGGIVDMPGPGDDFMDGTDADDLPRSAGHLWHHPAPLKLTHRFTGTEELPGQVDPDHLSLSRFMA